MIKQHEYNIANLQRKGHPLGALVPSDHAAQRQTHCEVSHAPSHCKSPYSYTRPETASFRRQQRKIHIQYVSKNQ